MAAAETIALNDLQFLTEFHSCDRRPLEATGVNLDERGTLWELESLQLPAICETAGGKRFENVQIFQDLNAGRQETAETEPTQMAPRADPNLI
jgi:hypothetical protein